MFICVLVFSTLSSCAYYICVCVWVHVCGTNRTCYISIVFHLNNSTVISPSNSADVFSSIQLECNHTCIFFQFSSSFFVFCHLFEYVYAAARVYVCVFVKIICTHCHLMTACVCVCVCARQFFKCYCNNSKNKTPTTNCSSSSQRNEKKNQTYSLLHIIYYTPLQLNLYDNHLFFGVYIGCNIVLWVRGAKFYCFAHALSITYEKCVMFITHLRFRSWIWTPSSKFRNFQRCKIGIIRFCLHILLSIHISFRLTHWHIYT